MHGVREPAYFGDHGHMPGAASNASSKRCLVRQRWRAQPTVYLRGYSPGVTSRTIRLGRISAHHRQHVVRIEPAVWPWTQRHELLEVGDVTLGGDRADQAGRCLVISVSEGVRIADGCGDQAAGGCEQVLATAGELYCAGQDEERFVVGTVDVLWRTAPPGRQR